MKKFNFSHLNFLGKLEHFQGSAKVGFKSTEYNVSLTKPMFGYSLISKTIAGIRYSKVDYTTTSSCINNNFETSISALLRNGIKLSYEGSIREILLTKESKSKMSLEEGYSIKSSLSVERTWSSLDDTVLPTRGSLLNLVSKINLS